MKLMKIWLLLFPLLGILSQTQAQSFDFFDEKKEKEHDYHITELAAIMLNDKVLVNDNPPNGPLSTNKMIGGKLTVQAVDRSGEKYSPLEPIGFKLGIKFFRTNTIWMYSDEILHEVHLGDVLKKCNAGDQLIFMTVDRKYRLPRHTVSTMDGC